MAFPWVQASLLVTTAELACFSFLSLPPEELFSSPLVREPESSVARTGPVSKGACSQSAQAWKER
jgi:hypothetical protein